MKHKFRVLHRARSNEPFYMLAASVLHHWELWHLASQIVIDLKELDGGAAGRKTSLSSRANWDRQCSQEHNWRIALPLGTVKKLSTVDGKAMLRTWWQASESEAWSSWLHNYKTRPWAVSLQKLVLSIHFNPSSPFPLSKCVQSPSSAAPSPSLSQ